MSNDKKDNEQQEYKGLSRTASVFGQSSVDSIKGGVAGTVAGAVIGAIAHNKEMHEAVRNGNTSIDTSSISGQVKAGWHGAPRLGKSAVMAIGLGAVVSLIASIVGAFRGFKKADEAKEQFKEITGENKNIKEKLADTQSRLASSEASISEIRSAIAHHPEQQKSHVADLNAERAAQAAQHSHAAI